MHDNGVFGRRLRLRHLYRRDTTGLLVVPLDHPIAGGPLWPAGPDRLDRLVADVAAAGADAVVLHKGAVRRVHPARFRDVSLVLHLTAGTGLAADPDAKYPVASVEEALRLGAEAVSVHVNVSSLTEDRQVAHLAAVAEQCDRWGMPLLAMMYVRGPDTLDGTSETLVARALAVAAELGADLVKTSLPAAPEAITRITAACPVPVLAAGGAGAAPATLGAALRAGAGGLAVGRLVFTAPDPAAMTRRLSEMVHHKELAVTS
ncbi:2-amino-3,7-dideoxy-D-threo-hept-6-ulosonate synthase [Actinoplanes sp. N902-109]|uniref:2-amino-3,7-dideoxy-D-threo-hept-6-ulosonate synthase n=1 Tax=Actinoplanes sp. (strain N902-109) TaxID=649831 RepID=UPI0003295CE1|nr:2-amino-3,7-dideoxy-D-threo-hept-6-ulosonate synthase [Actinoplanes sp. N902-109]AGL18887.1 2-amino-3,7-dideoxy-D-threo-hept-6-ulosonate synthase [Actinoplanes sp. N902-109]